MLNVVLLLSLFALSLGDIEACSNSYIPGPITYTSGGVSTTGYIIQAGGANSWGPVSTSGSQVTSGMGPRFYLANTCAAFSSSVFTKFNLLGSTISWTANLAVGCGQNAAFYLVGMPATSGGTAEAGTNGDYYCDANCVGGYCCPEMDLMEANRHAFQVTPHACTSPTSGCDAGGCAKKFDNTNNYYGPGTTYKINTLNSFGVSITFKSTSSALSSIVTVLSQPPGSTTNTISLTHDSSCGNNLSGMTSALIAGMVPTWSFWQGSMMWLDSGPCSSDTSEVSSPSFVFSSLAITAPGTVVPVTAAPPPPPPPPGSLSCGTTGCTTNAYWVEFTPPTGTSNPISPLPTVKCTSGSWGCTWDGNSKYQCSITNGGSTGCVSPVPQYNGKACPITSSADTVDSTASASTGLSTTAVAVIAVVACIVAIAIVIVIVVVVTKKQTEEYV